MSRKRNESINRRDFVRSSTAAVVMATYLGPTKSLAAVTPSSPLVAIEAVDIMKAAASSVLEINEFFKRTKDEFEGMKKIKAGLKDEQCAKCLSIIDTVVRIVVATIIDLVTLSAGDPRYCCVLTVSAATQQLSVPLASVVILEGVLVRDHIMTPDMNAAIARFRELCAQVIDMAVARDVFFHLSQDKTHATKLLDAVKAKNRAAIEELLRLDASGRTVSVQDAKEDNGVFLNVRLGGFTHCFSTSAQCGGKQFSFTK